MLETSNKQIVYFVLLGIFFLLYPTMYLQIGSKFDICLGFNKGHILYALVIAVASAVMFYAIYRGVGTTELYEGEFSVTPAKLCRGGPYTWQGNSKRAKMCRQMYANPEGKKQIDRYNCGSAFTGMPGKRFEYTPLSGPGWKNKRCEGKQSDLCDVSRNGIF